MTDQVKEWADAYWWLVNDLIFAKDHYNNEAKFYYNYESFYGLDQRRTEYHNELCKALGVEKAEIKYITDNLDKYDCFEKFLEALEKHINPKGKI